MKVAITGINSGIAKVLVPILQNDPSIEKIVGIDVSSFKGDPVKIEFLKIDIRDSDNLEKALKGTDVLIHLAFIVIPNKIPPLNEIYDININGSIRVFKAAAKNSVKKIIHLSSVSAYGHIDQIPYIVDENSALLGIKTKDFYYSYSKAVVELFLDKFSKKYPFITITRIRPPIIAGGPFRSHIISLKTLGRIKIIPQKIQGLLQLVHIDDLCEIINFFIKHDYHGPINVTSNPIDYHKFLQTRFKINFIFYIPIIVINLIIKIGKLCKPLSRYTGWIQAYKNNSILKSDLIKTLIKGWKPKYSTEQCIELALKNLKK